MQFNEKQDNHRHIIRKLDYFYQNQKIPHILFYGPTHSAKDSIVSDYINKIYDRNTLHIKHNVLFVSCSGKGIKFIRDEIKTFAKMHIQVKDAGAEPEDGKPKDAFKTVVLMNADFLTDDAQSALRRSIELFSYNTRFFLLVENRSKLLKPILSRFCEIYIPPPSSVDSRSGALSDSFQNAEITQKIAEDIAVLKEYTVQTTAVLRENTFQNTAVLGKEASQKDLVETVTGWIERGFSSYDFLNYVESLERDERCICIQFLFHKWKTEYRCEKLFLWTLLDFFLFRSYADLQRLCCY